MARKRKNPIIPDTSAKAQMKAEASTPFEEALIELLFKEPWYCLFLQKFTRQDNDKLPAPAGVYVKNNEIFIVINRRMFDPMPLNIRIGILKHEALHIVNKHIVREDGRNHKLWNIATDTAINQFIGHDDLPEGCYHWDREPLKDIQGISENLMSEKYYELIKQEAQENGYASIGADNAPGTNEGDEQGEGGSGEAQYDKDCSNCPANGKDGDGNNTCPYKQNNPNSGEDADGKNKKDGKDKRWNMVGDHSGWAQETGDDNDKDAVESIIKQKAKEARDQAEMTGRGTMPGHVSDAIDRLGRPSKIPWQQVLRDFVADSFESERRKSYRRENRRIDGIFPGRKRHPVPRFTVAIDTSGSMSDREIAACLDECEAIAETYNTSGFELWQFDAAVQSVEQYETGKYPKIHGRGGTDFDPVLEKCAREELASIIIMTDGGAPEPREYYGVKCYWVLTQGYWHEADNFKGRKVVIELDEDNNR